MGGDCIPGKNLLRITYHWQKKDSGRQKTRQFFSYKDENSFREMVKYILSRLAITSGTKRMNGNDSR